MTNARYRVQGMTCANCTKAVTDALSAVGGVKDVKVDLSKESVHLSYDEATVDPEYLVRVVKRAGYQLIIQGEKSAKIAQIRSIVTMAISAVFLVLGIMMSVAHIPAVGSTGFGHAMHQPILGLVMGTLCLVLLGYAPIRRAIAGLRSRRAGMDALVSMSALASYSVSTYIAIADLVTGQGQMTYYDALLMVLSVVTIGSFIESRVKALSGKRAQMEKDKASSRARVVVGSRAVEVEPEQVLKSDVVIVPQGETVPADGVVLEGQAELDTAALTGESTPRHAGVGDLVYASSICLSGSLRVRCETDNLDSMAAKLERESSALNSRKGHLGKLSDRIAMWFVPTALIIAIVAFVANLFTLPGWDWETALIRAASVLVVSCPCAFGLAVPLTSLNGFYAALRAGLLFKDGSTFERVRKIQVALFDKTGTLTSGHMMVTAYHGSDETLAMAKGLESISSHPIARAILDYRPEIEGILPAGATEVSGQGITSEAGSIGRIKDIERETVAAWLDNPEGATLVAIRDAEGNLIGALALEDELVAGVEDTLKALRDAGVETRILTGDGAASAQRLGRRLGFRPEQIASGLTPLEKTQMVEKQAKDAIVAYVGDGVNDLGALAAAQLAIAAATAIPAARSKADCTLLQPGLKALPSAIRISRRCYWIIVENFAWALAYNIALIPLAALGLMPMWLCAAAMIASNITLMLNSLRASRQPGQKR